jgi:hypothetical protein
VAGIAQQQRAGIMIGRVLITPGTKVGLILAAEERKLLLDSLCLDDVSAETLRITPVEEPVSLTLDQWDDFSCCVATEARRTMDEDRLWRLYAVFVSVERLFQTFTEDMAEAELP